MAAVSNKKDVAVRRASPAKRVAAARRDISDELLESLQEAVDIIAGTKAPARFHPAPAAVDVRAIRRKLGLSQPGFASRFGFTLATVRDWEQGRRRPEQAARTLLLVIDRNPQAVTDVLETAS
jgi:putative transcriptional regulator